MEKGRRYLVVSRQIVNSTGYEVTKITLGKFSSESNKCYAFIDDAHCRMSQLKKNNIIRIISLENNSDTILKELEEAYNE